MESADDEKAGIRHLGFCLRLSFNKSMTKNEFVINIHTVIAAIFMSQNPSVLINLSSNNTQFI